MKKGFDAGAVLERLKDYFQVSDNAGLAKKLGISAQAVSNWKTRNTLDFELILEKTPTADLNVIFRGVPLEPAQVKEIEALKARLVAVERKVGAK